jgi:predicted metal-dependent peptidase
VPTAGTNGKAFFWNPDFVATLTADELLGVMAHEVMHMALKHSLRRYNRNPIVWNWACDYAINPIVTECGMTLPKGGLLDPNYKGMSADAIYNLLMKEQDKHGRDPDGEKDSDPDKRGRGRGRGPGGKNGPDTMHGDVMDPGEMSPEERAKVERGVRQRVAQAAMVARMAGKLTGSLEAMVGAILNPTVPWPDLLRDYMTRVSKDDESWQRRNRRYTDVILPARWSQRMGEIVIIGDTSGSVTEEELNKVAAEVNAIAEGVRPELVRVVWADTEVKREETFEPGEPIKLHPLGRGGTDMRVPLEHVERYDAQVVVLITDGHTPWPSAEPPYPLIVCCTTQTDVPIGSVVRV